MNGGTSISALVRKTRGKLSIAEAHRRTKLSRDWWTRTEGGISRPTAEKLVQLVESLGGDLGALLQAAGYDPEPFIQDATVSPATVTAKVNMPAVTAMAVEEPTIAGLDAKLDELLDLVRNLGGKSKSKRADQTPTSMPRPALRHPG